MSVTEPLTRLSVPVTADETAVYEGYIYKTCKKASVVVQRYLRLQQESFVTYHNYETDRTDKRSWDFSRNCKIEPRLADEITSHEKTIRPPGQTTLQTIAKGGKKVSLFCFSVLWPTGWATKGYTSFTLGAPTKEEAMRLHALFDKQMALVKAMRISKHMHHRTASKDSELSADMVAEQKDGRASSYSLPDLNSIPGSQRDTDLPINPSINSATNATPNPPSSPDSLAPPESSLSPGKPSHPHATPRLSTTEASIAAERWVPYKHVNGVAIYYNSTKLLDGVGPEYMASSVVRGSPKACLDVLMDSASLTTLLGPATDVSVLHEDKAAGTQLMRLMVDAPGMAGRMCAPREVLLERMYKKEEEDTIHVVMFTSKDHREHQNTPPIIRHTGLLSPRQSFWRHPVNAKVKGGYTIAPLQGQGDDSDESLVTCILHVELGGWCSKGCFLGPVCDLMGFNDAFVERMLMGVILIKDEVEQQRFELLPFSYLSADEHEEDEEGDGPLSELGSVRRTSTMVVRARDTRQISRMSSTITVSRSLDLTPEEAAASPKKVATLAGPDGQLASVGEEEGAEGAGSATLMMGPPTLAQKYWAELHRNGAASPFKVRGPNYLVDRKKIQAGEPVFTLGAVDLVKLDGPTYHVARYLPSVRKGKAPYAFVIQLIIPGTPCLGLVVTFVTEHHPDELGPPPDQDGHTGDWQPFDYLLHKFLNGNDDDRNGIFKLIPHVAEGSWVIKQSVGSTPVIMGRKLKTTYHFTKRYVEVDVDISANATATYVVSMVRGALKGLVVDLGFVLEGQAPCELPESLVGAVRFLNMDLGMAVQLDTSTELPMADL